jgi:hypothetical protein
MIVPLLLLALNLSNLSAAELGKKELQFVERFVKADIGDLTPENIQYFMTLDTSGLPAKLREKAEARRLELHTLRQVAGVKRAPLRMPEKDCEADANAKSTSAKALLMAGYMEITEDDLFCIMKKTECTERDLMCEFTLQIAPVFNKKGKPDGRRVFFHQNDPITTLLPECRNPRGVGGNTNFFGLGMQPKCAK